MTSPPPEWKTGSVWTLFNSSRFVGIQKTVYILRQKSPQPKGEFEKQKRKLFGLKSVFFPFLLMKAYECTINNTIFGRWGGGGV